MSKPRRSFTREFKVEAVKLVTEQGRSFAEAAANLGIAESLLRKWKQNLDAEGDQAFPGKGNLPALEEELRRLRAENKRLQMERDILKKATGLLCQGVAMRYRFIEEHRNQWPVRLMCQLLQVSPGGYYTWRSRPGSAQQQRREVLTWRGGWERRHQVHQGLRRYDQLRHYADLRARVTALRGEGQTGEQIAVVLGGAFTGDRVRRLFMLLGLTGVPAGASGSEGLPGPDEWWLPQLAAELGVKPIVVHRWRWSGWVHARQLPGENGRWIVWADGAERRRLRRLRRHEIQNRGREAPKELRQPKARTEQKKRRKQ